MYLNKILEELSLVNDDLPIKCYLTSEKLYSNIYVVGQIKPGHPGVVLGDREPHLREKNVGGFVQELKTFGEKFGNNDFLFEFTRDLDETHYEIRYFKLSNIVIDTDSLLLQLDIELTGYRETHEEPQLE
ncbi:hypothetical protein AB6C44_20200 [Vibrio splendidus]